MTCVSLNAVGRKEEVAQARVLLDFRASDLVDHSWKCSFSLVFMVQVFFSILFLVFQFSFYLSDGFSIVNFFSSCFP